MTLPQSHRLRLCRWYHKTPETVDLLCQLEKLEPSILSQTRGAIHDGGGCVVGINVAGAVKDHGLRERGPIAPLGVAVSGWESHSGAGRGDHLGVQD